MNPTLSIIVPCYNQAAFLSETLDSILKQTFRDWECIVVNDGSPDNTSQVAGRYVELDPRFSLIETENRGVSAARNTGIRASHGEFILPLDGDDLIMPDYTRLAIERFRRFPETKVVYCEARFFGQKNGYWELPEYQWKKFIFRNSIFNPCIFRRSDYDKTSGYTEDMRVGLEDWDFLLSLINKDDIVYRIPKVLLQYRIKQVSKSVSEVPANRDALTWQIINNHPDIYRDFLFDSITHNERYNSTEKLERSIGHAVTKPVRLLRKLIHWIKSFAADFKYKRSI